MLLEPQPATPEQRQAQMLALEKLLLERPAVGDRPPEEEPLDAEALHRAAELGDLKALSQMDKRLKALLDSDEGLQRILKDDLADPLAKEALRLYRDSFMSLEGLQKGTTQIPEKEAFQAVMHDDAAALRSLLERGLSPEQKNAGGHTLLQLARERGKRSCEEVLLGMGAKS